MDMKSFKSAVPGAILSALFSAGLILALLSLGTATDDEMVDDFTVTVEYDCRIAIMTPSDFPEQVVTECRNKVRFLTEPSNRPPAV